MEILVIAISKPESYKAGVLQGDMLAPYIFAIVLYYFMRQTHKDREEELGFTLQK